MPHEIGVIEQQFDTAQALMNALDLSEWTDEGNWSCPWVFRGQSDAAWDLSPAAWRRATSVQMLRLSQLRESFSIEFRPIIIDKLKGVSHRWTNFNIDNIVKAYAQARAEFKLILEFVKLADELGHPVPEMETYINRAIFDYLPDLCNGPSASLLPGPNSAAALAQHHGIPTRFLDWTRNPLYGAYFAASDVKSHNAAGKIAIWALRPDNLRSPQVTNNHNSDFTRFLDFTAPKGNNRYLHSQDGLFLYPVYGCAHCETNGAFPSLELFALAIERKLSSPTIKKFTLPYSEIGQLIRLLWLKGVSKAHLMPTMDNVTQALCLKWECD